MISIKAKTMHAANVHLKSKQNSVLSSHISQAQPKTKTNQFQQRFFVSCAFSNSHLQVLLRLKILSLLKSGRKLHSSHEINLCVYLSWSFHVKLISVFRPGSPHSTSFFPIVTLTNFLRGALLLFNTAGPLFSLACFHYL